MGKRRLFGCCLAAVVSLVDAPAARAESMAVLRDRVRDLARLTAPPAVHEAPGFTGAGGVRALFFDGLPYRGQPTRVFAWYGAPARAGRKLPGVVLVHGGGGSAYEEWVRKWNDHGFAAISIAVEGQTSEREGARDWKRHAWAGPARTGIYGDRAEPLEDQWMYHAVADTILANSLIRSFPEIDAARVGLTGISWGGVIASTVAGLDPRFAFAIPTYGCGAMADADNQWGKALHDNELYRQVWDPVLWLPNARMPILWLTWLRDEHFPLTSQSASYRAAPSPRSVAVLPDMKHSHPAGWNPPDSYAFAESVVRSGRPWLRQLVHPTEADRAVVEFASAQPIDSAVLFSSPDNGFTGRRKWVETPAPVERSGESARISAPLPPGTRAWFINVKSGALTGSSDFIEIHPQP